MSWLCKLAILDYSDVTRLALTPSYPSEIRGFLDPTSREANSQISPVTNNHGHRRYTKVLYGLDAGTISIIHRHRHLSIY
jgi:hypothetical protein